MTSRGLASLTLEPSVLKWGGSALLVLALASTAGIAAAHPRSPLKVWWHAYLRFLDRQLRELFLTTKPQAVASLQLVTLAAIASVSPLLSWTVALGLVGFVVIGPIVDLHKRRKKRLRALEGQ